VKKVAEQAKIAVRNTRRDAMDKAKKQEKSGELTEDDLRDMEKSIQQATDDAIKEIDALTTEKEKELLDV
jgi:ribosome recycling factor